MVTANQVFRDYETDGVPSSGAHEVKKSEVRELLTGFETIINAFLSSGGLIYSSKASLDADLAHGANSMAWVIGDPTVANNGIYRKNGASGTGSWTRVADLPFSFIIASDAGAGTPNAIQATTSIPVSGSALIWMNIFEANTASPVTVSFNGGSALTIKTNSGNDVVAGGLTAGTIVLGIVSGSTFRLVSDQASAAIIAAAEAAAERAEAAAAYVTGIDTVTVAEAGLFPNSVRFLQLLGRNTYGDGGAFKAVEVTEDGSPLQPGQFKTNLNLKRWENAENIVTPAMFADPVEMFAFTKAQIHIPADDYEFDAPMQTQANAIIRMEEGAIWRPTFELATAIERTTPYFKLSVGTSLDRLDVRLVTGINQVRTLIEANAKTRLGRVYLYSDDPNNNRVSEAALDAPYLENGAIVFKGDGIRVENLVIDHFDRGMTCIGATNLSIGYREILRHIMGAYYQESENIFIMGGRGTGMSEADAATCSGRGRMTPGANLNCFAGATNVHVYGEKSYGALEHANRVGLREGTILNDGIWYHGCTAEFSYGCGFKQDDGDAGLIRNIHYIQPVTIDIGAGVWGEANDGNKQAVAVRNSIRTVITGHINRAINTANSGQFGEWFERSDDVTSVAPDIEGARDAGIMISNNGLDIESIQIRGGRLYGNGRGLAVVPGSNHVIRGMNISDLKSSGNTGLDVDIQARPDAASPFVSTEKSRIEADAPKVSIAGAVYADADFSSNIFIGKARALYNPPSLANGSSDTTTLTVTGAVLGDRVTVAFGDTQGVTMTASVTAADTVSVRFQNNTGATVDIVQSAIVVQVFR